MTNNSEVGALIERLSRFIRSFDKFSDGKLMFADFTLGDLRKIETLYSRVKELDWRPIETAPKTPDDLSETRDFLAWCPDADAPNGGDCRVVWWEPHHDSKGAWWGDRDLQERPTHWMPLPAPPNPSIKEG